MTICLVIDKIQAFECKDTIKITGSWCMSEWESCRRRLLEQANEFKTRIGKLLSDAKGRESEAEVEALRSRLREMEARVRELSRPGSALDELRQGAGRTVGKLKEVWRKTIAR